jgi:UDP-N-acetyl-D-mannosaminuronate dehydrogenase
VTLVVGDVTLPITIDAERIYHLACPASPRQYQNDPIATLKTSVVGTYGYEALTGADALLLVTEWSEFRRPDFARVKALMRTPVILDGRNIWDPMSLRALGFIYRGVGRSDS